MTTYECNCGWTVAGSADPDDVWDDLDTMIEQHELICSAPDMDAVERAIRENLPRHRAEHLLKLIGNENGTGNPAKSSPDAADSTNLIGERTVNESTANDTSENIVPNLADFIEIIDLGTAALPATTDPKDGKQLRVKYRTVFDFDTYRVEVTRDDEQHITADYSIPAIPKLTAEESRRIRTKWALDILEGKIREDRTLLFIDYLEAAFDEAEARLKHPATCARDGDCLIRAIGSEIVHTSPAHELASPSFNAEARFEVITDCLDYAADSTHLEDMLIAITGSTEAFFKGSVADVRALGNFLIEQADRFRSRLEQEGE